MADDDPANDDPFDAEADGTRRTRWGSLVGLSVGRLWKRALRTRSGRIVATISAVALTIALLIVVTGVAMALADGGAIEDTDANVQISPEETGTMSAVDGVEGPRLGATNERAETIGSEDGVEHASPVLVEPVKLEPTSDGDEPQTILLVGVVPDDEDRTVGGLSTNELESGDPHYANGSYDGSQQGEMVLSEAAAERLEASADDDLSVASAHVPADVPAPTVTATAVEEASDGNDDETPVALVHLSELQTLSGANDGELADQVLVWGESAAGESAAENAYSDAAVESTDRTDPSTLFGDGLAFATSLLAFVVGIAICASFVATTAGMTVNEDRRMLAVLESVGFPTHSQLLVVAVSTVVTTLGGALLGILFGVGGIYAVNAVASATVAPGAVAQFHPVFVPYALVVALFAGLIAVPYPLVVAARTSVLEEVGR